MTGRAVGERKKSLAKEKGLSRAARAQASSGADAEASMESTQDAEDALP